MKVTIKTLSGQSIDLEVDANSETVSRVKAKAQSEAAISDPRRNLRGEEECLVFNGKTLDDEGQTLAASLDVNADGGTVILQLIFKPLQPAPAGISIGVKLCSGNVLTVHVQPNTDTVRVLKAKLQEHAGVPMARQRPVFGGKELTDDSATLADYGVQNDDAILYLREHPQ